MFIMRFNTFTHVIMTQQSECDVVSESPRRYIEEGKFNEGSIRLLRNQAYQRSIIGTVVYSGLVKEVQSRFS